MDTNQAPVALDSHSNFDDRVSELVRWHFDPRTGSPFWLQRAASLPFDPLTEIRTTSDLLMFPDVSDDLRTVPVQDLIPQGVQHNDFCVYESGGTSGPPKRIVNGAFRIRMLSWAMLRLMEQGVAIPAHWLHLGPSGPHVFGYDCASYARLGNGTFYTVDFDPRWVKKLIAAGQSDVVERYITHLLDQLLEILTSQPIRVMSTTPPLIEAICARPELHALVQKKVATIVWAGTSFSPESLRQVKEYYFPDTNIIGIYGNTLMGVAPQRPAQPEDPSPCVFEPFPEAIRVELINEDGSTVGYGERGRVRVHLVTEEMFLPNVVERDTAVRVAPTHAGAVDGLAEVRTFKTLGEVQLVEGVY
ncbi:phenazine antibiotic biosynthesis protein [Rhizocola hellebori]|uniref:Phenazine antibiotic biosynthesis protein n=1 Tax=Rhizocola hellebori TaxID=1392758 RepID=A0A8J3VGQ6_9ACTN|nr:hypothetical protein [Rhizocola hellebori]GIH05143.1 phenazine antibiotic biosynthesis protein [Rhizocola hellebori]